MDLFPNDETAVKTTNKNEMSEILKNVVDEIDEPLHSKDPLHNKIISGYNKLDQILLGFRNGDLNIIASRPSIGKTLFALSMFVNMTKHGINSLYLSFEKSETALVKDIMLIKANLDSDKIERGFITADDFKNMVNSLEEIDNCKSIFIETLYNTDLIKLKDIIKNRLDKNNIKIVFIDYLHMIVPSSAYTNRWEQVSEISRSLKTMAMEFNIPFIVLCPVNRNVEGDKPKINDLSESCSIEYEADRIIILHKKIRTKEELENENEYKDTTDEKFISVYIAKNRRGPTASLDFLFNYKYRRVNEVIHKDERC